LRSTAGSPSHTSFMLDEPRRQTLVLDSGRRSAEPLEHADARARFPLASPSRRQQSLRTSAARATRKCQHGQRRGSRSAGKTFSSAKTTGTRIPVGIVQVAMSADHTLARIRELPPHPARRFPASRPTPASESVHSRSCARDNAAGRKVPALVHSNRLALRRRGTMVRLRGGTATTAPPPTMAIGCD
jgi:hypothetical protein